MGSLALRLGDAVADQYQAGVPAAILSKGKDLLLNAASVAIAGREHPAWMLLSRASSTPLGHPTSRHELRGARQTALLFAAAANVHDFDDGDAATLVHPTCVNLGAALGAATLKDVTGRDLLIASLIGCEMELRFARALGPDALARGWDLNGVCGTLSAAITAALLLGSSPEVLASALSIAASSTLGQLSSIGTMLKFFVIGKASANGLASALLSARGFTASSHALDSPRGLGAALIRRPDAFDSVADKFGTEWLLEEVFIKRYPCAILLHPVVDAALQLRAITQGEAGTKDVSIRCHPLTAQLTSRPRPADGLDAKVSAQHCAATALREGNVGLAHFTDGYVSATAAAASRIRIEASDRLAPTEAEAEVCTDRPESSDLDVPCAVRSVLSSPVAREVTEKARHLAPDRQRRELAESLIAFVSNMQEQPDVRLLLDISCA
jgi:2-methylcitrate dehydratase PrpD